MRNFSSPAGPWLQEDEAWRPPRIRRRPLPQSKRCGTAGTPSTPLSQPAPSSASSEPVTGIGGDCFALLSRGGSEDVIAYNGSGRTPGRGDDENGTNSHGVESIERHSPHAVTIPAPLKPGRGWSRIMAAGRCGAEPAVELAKDGYAVSPRVAHEIGKQRDLLRRDQTANRIFLSDGEAPGVGTLAAAARTRKPWRRSAAKDRTHSIGAR